MEIELIKATASAIGESVEVFRDRASQERADRIIRDEVARMMAVVFEELKRRGFDPIAELDKITDFSCIAAAVMSGDPANVDRALAEMGISHTESDPKPAAPAGAS